MRQVPLLAAPPFGIVGNGRVARHFLHYFNLLGLPVRSWSRRISGGDPIEALAPCRTVLVLITDSAIVPFIERWDGLGDKRLIHFSGSLVTNAAQAVHPLMTFGHDLYDRDTYTTFPFVLDAGGTSFHELFPGLPNPSFTIPATDRPYYHALCVLAGNCSVLLWRKLFAELSDRWGIPASAGHPYLKQIAANLHANAGSALTGPLARGDVETLRTDLNALEGDSFQDVYAAFVRVYEHRS